MAFTQTVAYSDSDAAIYVNNLRVALVRSITERVKTELHELKAIGEAQPVSITAGGKSFEVVLTREESNDAIIFPMLDEFTLRVKRAYSVVTYSKCRLKSVEIERRAGEPLLEKITLTAEGRKEV
nr:MAG TPA: tail tube protein [Caudoviricetes sp.]